MATPDYNPGEILRISDYNSDSQQPERDKLLHLIIEFSDRLLDNTSDNSRQKSDLLSIRETDRKLLAKPESHSIFSKPEHGHSAQRGKKTGPKRQPPFWW